MLLTDMTNEKKQQIDSQIPSDQLPLSTFKVKKIKTALLLRQKKLSLLRNILATLLLLGVVGISFAFYRSGGAFAQNITTLKARVNQNCSIVAAHVIPQSLGRMHYYSIRSSAAVSDTAAKEIKESIVGLHEKTNLSLIGTYSSVFCIDIKEKLQQIADAFSKTKAQWLDNSSVFSIKTKELRNSFAYNTTFFLKSIGELIDKIKVQLNFN